MTRPAVALFSLALLAAPLAARAQPAARVPRIGFLALGSASAGFAAYSTTWSGRPV